MATREATKQRLKQVVRRTVGEPYVGKRLKLRRLHHAMSDLGQPRTILDAGAEDATFVYWLADRYPHAHVTAVDIDEAAVQACRAARPARYRNRVEFGTSYFADLEPASFDLITALDVLEHIVDDRGAARDLWRALKPGGTLLVHVPRDRWLTRDGVVHEYSDEDAWQINPGHVRQGYSPREVRELLSGAGFAVVEVETWIGRWGTLAHGVYDRLAHPMPLRILTVPLTDFCAWMDRRRPTTEGNSVYARAIKPVG